MALVLVRGAGDVGSAVAHAPFAVRHQVVLHDSPTPSHPRRGMSFTDALYHGQADVVVEAAWGENLGKVVKIALAVLRIVADREASPAKSRNPRV